MKFRKIPQLSRPVYSCYYDLSYIKRAIELYQEAMCPLDLEPDFHRAHVWTKEQKIKYIEFILRGGNFARDIYFNCPGWMKDFRGPFEIIDGKQRIQACLDFINGIIPVFDTWYFKDFEEKQSGSYLHFHINNLKTRKEILKWYLIINSGGVIHTQEELDRARELLKKEI